MKFEAYCDESRPDLLCSQNRRAQFMVIGSLWLRAEHRARFKADLHALRNQHRVGGEFKWQKVSPSRVEFYCDLMHWFVAMKEDLRFRCIVVEPDKVNLRLHEDDAELGFYKFYYQLLHHWILDFNEYAIFVDFKRDRAPDRLPVLQRCLAAANLSSTTSRVQAIDSSDSVLLQLADVLTGVGAYRLNNQLDTNRAKFRVLTALEQGLRRPLAPTNKSEQKYNVFRIDLGGGW